MTELVEGDWNDFTFKMAKKEDFPKILEHLRNNFYRDEPINKYLGQGELKTKDMDMVTMLFLEQGKSFYAEHRLSGKIAGVRIMDITHKSEDNIDEVIAMMESEESKNLMPTLLEMRAESNIYDRYSIESYGDFLFVSVDKEFRGQGLATEMYNRAIKFLQSKGITIAESLFTSPISQKIANKMGFVEVTRRYLKDFKTLDGRPLLPEAGDDEVGILMVKKF